MLRFSRLCGNTPLIKISDRIYGKLETYNPTGSVKDRMIEYVVSNAIEKGLIDSNTILCEATSGNTGIALSAVAAALGLQCIIFMPQNMSQERKDMMKVYGARLEYTGYHDFHGAIKKRDEFLKDNHNSWSPLQFSNPVNIECHQTVTAPEIHSQVDCFWGAFVHGSGTGGTLMGVKNYIDSQGLDTKVYLTAPAEEKHGIQGINDGADFLLDKSRLDGEISIRTDDAIERAKEFAKETGILVGISSGANILASEKVLPSLHVDQNVITMLCDRGERYMSIYGALL